MLNRGETIMNKILKQLVQVLDEEGIQLEKIELQENSIVINGYLHLSKTDNYYVLKNSDSFMGVVYSSLTHALDNVAEELSKVQEGATLVSGNGKYTYKVIKHRIFDKYNLLNVETNQLEYIENVELGLIQKQINAGVYVK